MPPHDDASPVSPDLGFDPQALKARYLAERDRRVRDDGNQQYLKIEDEYGHYMDDPYVAPGFTRDPIDRQIEALVVGGGFGGQLAAVRMQQAGIDDVWMVEKGGDFGGTWYWNRYPGAACDIESFVYLPLLEETGFMPSFKYTRAAEILAYSQMIGRKFDLYRNALFQTEITEMRWDEAARRWNVTTNRGDCLRARFLCLASGPLHRPKLPGIAGIETYKGHSFHTSRWDYDYTGGTSDGGLDKLADKRVGIIGTGATAVQCVPHLGAGAQHLYVFQRTPSSVDVRNDRPTDPDWAASLKPGWQKHRMDNFNILVTGGHQDEDLVNDGWTDIIRNIGFLAQTGKVKVGTPEELADAMQMADFRKMEQIRARVDEIVKDPVTAAALKPWYNQFCKRPCFHDDYLPTFNRPNVTLVDTKGQGVDRITENGVVVDGVEYELDCLIYATGFEVGTEYSRRAGFELYGRDGLTLTQKWSQGVRSLHGMHVRDFPNCFLMSNAQSGFTANYPHMLDEQAVHAAYIIRQAQTRQVNQVEAAPEAEETWIETIKKAAILRQKFLEECTPGYYNNEGKPSQIALQNSSYGRGPVAFVQLLEGWRDKGELEGLELSAG